MSVLAWRKEIAPSVEPRATSGATAADLVAGSLRSAGGAPRSEPRPPSRSGEVRSRQTIGSPARSTWATGWSPRGSSGGCRRISSRTSPRPDRRRRRRCRRPSHRGGRSRARRARPARAPPSRRSSRAVRSKSSEASSPRRRRDEELLGAPPPALRGDVTGDHRGADDAALRVLDRGDRQRDVDADAVLADPLGLVGVERFAAAHAIEDHCSSLCGRPAPGRRHERRPPRTRCNRRGAPPPGSRR